MAQLELIFSSLRAPVPLILVAARISDFSGADL